MSKAFTIIEMLAIIVIMGIMLVLVLPNLLGISDKNKQNKYDQLVDNICLAAETYINMNYENPVYPLQVELQTLMAAGYLDESLTNPLTGEELDYDENVLATKNADNTITYTYPDTSDIGNPTVVFSPNGAFTSLSIVNIVVTVSDNKVLNTASLKYLWTTSATSPTEASFSTGFTNGGTISTPSGASGTYYLWILAKDSIGNTTIKKSNPFKLDSLAPTVVFGTNGNSTYAKTRSTTVTVTDVNLINSSLKYLWTTTTTAPTEASFSTSFTNGGTITTPSSVTGGYYLWILAKDTIGNKTITRSNVFNLDNASPVITMLGSSPVTIRLNGSYTDAGATVTDAISGTLTVTSTSTVVTTTAGTYTVTYTTSDTSGNTATLVRTVNVKSPTVVTFTAGSNYFDVPAGVTTIDVVLVGGGGGGRRDDDTYKSGGGGGGLRTITNFAVTPGERLILTVGYGGQGSTGTPGAGGDTSLLRGTNVIVYAGGGGRSGTYSGGNGGAGSIFSGNGSTVDGIVAGGDGGAGGGSTSSTAGGGGGAGGYTGNGGNGNRTTYSTTAGAGSGGGGAGGYSGQGGGGVGILGPGTSGTASGTGGSGGGNGQTANFASSGGWGGSYGGGGAGGDDGSSGASLSDGGDGGASITYY